MDMPRQTLSGEIMIDTEEYLLATADRCTRLARMGRELAADLEAMSRELMAKAVELDTNNSKKRKQARGGNAT
jgi:hypothetical protein